MNNEPVAWLIQAKTWHEFTFEKPLEDNENESIEVEPLYTHPHSEESVKVKELTDEEIDKIENKVYLNTIAKGKPLGAYSKELVKAILRKASEK